MALDPEERRETVYDALGHLRDRITRLETLSESGERGQALMATQLLELTKAITGLSLQVNTIETQRNTVVGVAALLGSFVTALGGWVFRTVTGGR